MYGRSLTCMYIYMYESITSLTCMQVAMLNETLRELGSRVVQARQQGQEAAELKKSGEISVLEKELGSKSKYSSCIVTKVSFRFFS